MERQKGRRGRRNCRHESGSHEIQLDEPQAVIDAVDELLRQLQAGAKS
jgi:hypothetical protein